ncbi:MAG TPA: hypothetical protein VFT66_03185 [Roseiflexaceae bacterium]|jgi:uncharacterized membrane protein YeaQ/YmgE (transglycosylase-associated protein family)|nr:hypothetical protein [Roseiflexaceae bacterium]
MANIILWFVVGAVAGMIVTFIEGTHSPRGMVSNIVVGVIGGVLGGIFSSFVVSGGATVDRSGLSPRSAFAALVVAAILLALSYATSRTAAR